MKKVFIITAILTLFFTGLLVFRSENTPDNEKSRVNNTRKSDPAGSLRSIQAYRRELEKSGRSLNNREFAEILVHKGIRVPAHLLSQSSNAAEKRIIPVSERKVRLRQRSSPFSEPEIQRYENEIYHVLDLDSEGTIRALSDFKLHEKVKLLKMHIDERAQLHITVSDSFKQLTEDEDRLSRFQSLFFGIEQNRLSGLYIRLPEESLGDYLRRRDQESIRRAREAASQ